MRLASRRISPGKSAELLVYPCHPVASYNIAKPLRAIRKTAPKRARDGGEVVGFEPSSADIGVAFRSHRCRVELSSCVRFCVTDQASVTMIARWARMGNTAHPVPTQKEFSLRWRIFLSFQMLGYQHGSDSLESSNLEVV
jgi:hypothetical protein